MKYLSLFSGIEAATQAWQPLGWECVAVSEIEPFPCAVLEYHYPHVPNLGDVTKITEQQIKDLGQIDLIVFGSPCQNLSVAGNRKGFDGDQSVLFYSAMEIIKYAKQHCGARFALWENVPGAFSSNKGADFTEVVKHMAGLNELDTPANGWGKEGAAVGSNGLLEWSVLDAQWFGLAQRRKRVFAIVDFGDWASRPPILLERESLRGDSAPSRETRESVATDVRASTASSINFRAFGARVESELVGTLTATDYKEPHGVMIEPVAYPINTMNCQGRPSDNGRMGLGLGDDGDPCPTLTQNHSHAVAIAGNIIGRTEGNGGNGNGFDESGACCTLTNNDRHAVAYALNNDTTPKFCKELSMTLKVGGQGGSNAAVAYVGCLNPSQPQSKRVYSVDGVSPALQTGTTSGDITPSIFYLPSVVRRLTPIECERLQGFPDSFTKIPYRNKSADDCPNGVRYKAIGNSMGVNVMAWIGQRVQQAVAVKAYT